ncbi:MAG: F0F1 ATP synthase subunit delta [Chromatiales bacterium]|nr:F0F1 ATP synthase subunit delta [Chromatiales bacterium]
MAQSTTEQAKTARPYAEAVFKRAQESGTLSAWSEQLLLLATIAADEQMQGLIRNPRIARSQAAEVLLDVAAEGVDTEGRNLVHLLARNGRTGLLPEIQRVFEARKLESEGSVDVTIYSAYKVTQAQEKTLADALKRHLGKDVNVTSEKDPSLIGGVLIRAGDLVIDGSVRGRLAKMAAALGR